MEKSCEYELKLIQLMLGNQANLASSGFYPSWSQGSSHHETGFYPSMQSSLGGKTDHSGKEL